MVPITITNPGSLCNNCNIAGFTPVAHFAFAKAGNTVTMYDASTFPGADTLLIAKYRVSDKFGNSVRGHVSLTGSGHTSVLSTAALNLSKGFNIEATIITAGGIVADGEIADVSGVADGAGNLAYWDTQIAPAQA